MKTKKARLRRIEQMNWIQHIINLFKEGKPLNEADVNFLLEVLVRHYDALEVDYKSYLKWKEKDNYQTYQEKQKERKKVIRTAIHDKKLYEDIEKLLQNNINDMKILIYEGEYMENSLYKKWSCVSNGEKFFISLIAKNKKPLTDQTAWKDASLIQDELEVNDYLIPTAEEKMSLSERIWSSPKPTMSWELEQQETKQEEQVQEEQVQEQVEEQVQEQVQEEITQEQPTKSNEISIKTEWKEYDANVVYGYGDVVFWKEHNVWVRFDTYNGDVLTGRILPQEEVELLGLVYEV